MKKRGAAHHAYFAAKRPEIRVKRIDRCTEAVSIDQDHNCFIPIPPHNTKMLHIFYLFFTCKSSLFDKKIQIVYSDNFFAKNDYLWA